MNVNHRFNRLAPVSTLIAAFAAASCKVRSFNDASPTSEATPAQPMSRPCPASDVSRFDWYLDHTNWPAAEAMFTGKGMAPGQGVTIGVIDTGVAPHPEIFQNGKFIDAMDVAHGFDTLDNKNDPFDPMEKGIILDTRGHGTSTAATLVSPKGREAGSPRYVWNNGPGGNEGGITGVAYGARIIPVRVSRTPVYVGDMAADVAEGIQRLVDLDKNGTPVDVINISMGGLESPSIRRAVEAAYARGIIVLAAGGQWALGERIPYPASYSHAVISVAASNPRCRIWRDTEKGGDIALSAPGVDVLFAGITRADAMNPDTIAANPEHLLLAGAGFLGNRGNWLLVSFRPGVGTSFSTPILAGAAAQWLSFHGGRKRLLEKFGRPAALVNAFKYVLTHAGYDLPDNGANWDSNTQGFGILNFEKLLKAPLPASTHPLVQGKLEQAQPRRISGLDLATLLKQGNLEPAVTSSDCLRSYASARDSERRALATRAVLAAVKGRRISQYDSGLINDTKNALDNLCADRLR